MSRRLLSASLIAFFATTTTLAVGGSASASVPAKAPAQASVAAKPSPPPPDNNANPNNGPGGFKRHGTQNCPHPLKYPPLPCSLLLSKTQGPPGTAVNIVGHGYTPNCHVSIYFDATFLRQLPTGGRGAFRGQIFVPKNATVGKHVFSASDDCANFVLGVDFNVTPPSSSSSSSSLSAQVGRVMPHNQSVIWPVAGIGIAFLLSGARLMIVGRRRRSTV